MEEKKNNKYYEQILDWFNDQIMSGQLKEGDVIPSERELAARFGVSRVPVREALRILEYIGTVASTPEGMVVENTANQFADSIVDFGSEITKETLVNLFEVRVCIESFAAYNAALRRTDSDIEKMEQAISDMLSEIDNPERDEERLIMSSHSFHFYVIHAAGNPVLERIYKTLFELLEVSKQYTLDIEHMSEATIMDHEAILSKIKQKDAEGASRYMKFHLQQAKKKIDRA